MLLLLALIVLSGCDNNGDNYGNGENNQNPTVQTTNEQRSESPSLQGIVPVTPDTNGQKASTGEEIEIKDFLLTPMPEQPMSGVIGQPNDN